MSVTGHIRGVTVNHNTSHFVELMLRTRFLTNQLDMLDLTMTIYRLVEDDQPLHAGDVYAGAPRPKRP